jgi:hypothetical protein
MSRLRTEGDRGLFDEVKRGTRRCDRATDDLPLKIELTLQDPLEQFGLTAPLAELALALLLAKVAVAAELVDHLVLLAAQRLKPGAESSQLGFGVALPSLDGHQLSILDVAHPRPSDLGAQLRAHTRGTLPAAAQRDRRSDTQSARLPWQFPVHRRIPRGDPSGEHSTHRSSWGPPQTSGRRLVRPGRILGQPSVALSGE